MGAPCPCHSRPAEPTAALLVRTCRSRGPSPHPPALAPACLGRDVAERERFVHGLLALLVVAGGGHVAPVIAGAPVVGELGPETGTDPGVLAELGGSPGAMALQMDGKKGACRRACDSNSRCCCLSPRNGAGAQDPKLLPRCLAGGAAPRRRSPSLRAAWLRSINRRRRGSIPPDPGPPPPTSSPAHRVPSPFSLSLVMCSMTHLGLRMRLSQLAMKFVYTRSGSEVGSPASRGAWGESTWRGARHPGQGTWHGAARKGPRWRSTLPPCLAQGCETPPGNDPGPAKNAAGPLFC